MVSSRVISPFSFKTKVTLNNETPARFTLTTDVENINKRIHFFKYYNKKLIDPSKFVPKCWFNDFMEFTDPVYIILGH
jgi:hypothetical protein